MGLFSTLGIGTRGLAASQLASEVAGQNIANANVEGYSRKRVNITSAYRKDTQFGQMGFGVDIVNVERVRSQYIDEQIRQQNQQVGYYTQTDNTLGTLQNLFSEPTDNGIQHFVDQFFDSWENLANNPADISARTVVKTDAQMLCDAFHSVSGQMSDLKQGCNTQISTLVDQVNEITSQIYQLNLEISAAEVNNQHANDSRDQRDKLLSDLSKLIDVNTTENSQGQITVTTMGNIIVSPVGSTKLEMTTSTFTNPDGTSGSNVGIRFADSKKDYHPQDGQIKGLFDSRDTIIPTYQKQLDSLAVAISQKVNDVHQRGYSLMGYTGMSFFNPTVTGASDINIDASINADVQNIAAAQGGETRGASETINHTFGTPAIALANHNVMVGSVTVTDIASGAVLQEGVDYNLNYALGTFQLLNPTHSAQNLQINYQFNTGQFNGAGDNANAIAIGQLRQGLTMEPDVLGNGTTSFDQYYGSTVAKLGLDKNESASTLQTRQTLVEQYQTQQDGIAGVSLDEEMADLIKYQHTYAASAKLISTTSIMLDALMNMA